MRSGSELRGLSRLLLSAMIEATPSLVAEGEEWTPEIMSQLEASLHSELAPSASPRQRLVFDMVFNKAFGEARDQLLTLASVNDASQTTYRASGGRIIA